MARGEFILCLNPDTEFTSDCLTPLVEYMRAHLEVGVTGIQLLNGDGSLQDCFAEPDGLWWDFCEAHYLQGLYRRRSKAKWSHIPHGSPIPVGYVAGAFLLIRSNHFAELNGFDPDFFLNHEDIELCARVRDIGLDVQVVPALTLIHREGTTQRKNWRFFTFHRFVSKWIYIEKRRKGFSKFLAQLMWWEALAWKYLIGALILRASARSRLPGFLDAAKWVRSR